MVDREKALKEFGKKRLTKQLKQKLYNIIEGEVKTYNQYLAGDVYGYVVSNDNEPIDSCWGFYSQADSLSEAKSIVDYEVKQSVRNIDAQKIVKAIEQELGI
jgi:hypothetical protein